MERTGKKRNLGELSITAVCVVLGFLLAIQLKSVKLNTAADATSASRLETLQELYNGVADQKAALEQKLGEVQSELEEYRRQAASGDESGEALKSEVDRLEAIAGLTDVEGPGVTVVMQDSTAANTTGDEADYLIHDNDLLSVINELRDAGAEAISLNGERLLSTSEIRCTGAVVSVNGRRYAAPFIIFAIGDSTTLYNALTMRNGVVDVLGQWKIDVTVTMNEKLLVPRYNGAITMEFARPAAANSSGEEEAG